VRVELRAAGPDDEHFLQRVYAATRDEELERLPWSAEQRQAFVEQQFAAQTAHFAEHYEELSSNVILVAGEPAGRLLVARWDREMRIVDISLLPHMRGRGVGTALLRDLMDEASESAKTLSIHVERATRALGLYGRLGFRVAGEAGIYLRMEWEPPQLKTAS
jgi:ribosomal protein S18 acetylase RimI-like enzyme